MCRASRRPRPLILRESGPAAFGCFVFVSALLAICVAFMTPMPTWANPAGGTVISGGGTINQAPGATTITQTTDKTIIKWNSFNIANGELTQFIQPNANAIVLNRIIGGASVIDGRVLANGNVWLVNQNGILFGKNASIDVHGLLATTADIRDSDFMSGRFNFSIASPNPGASIINQGTISIGEAGLGGLVAPYVRNDGVIVGNLGQVILAGAPTFTLDFYGDGLIQFAATSKVLDAATPVVQNNGKISADGGQVLITANAAAGVVNESINVGGVVEARSFSAKNGTIILDGGENGAVRVTGTLDATGASAGQTGGTIKVLGDKVTLAEGSRLDASGYSGGGTVLVGGNFGGKGPERNASVTTVEKNADIRADAIVSGNGGKVAVWSNGQTDFYGTIFARGGSAGGNGGFAEISGKILRKHGLAYLTAAKGKVGTLLLDPGDYNILSAGGDATGAEISSQLALADVTLSTYDNITVNDLANPIDLHGNTFTLIADNNINIFSSIGTGSTDNVRLKAANAITEDASASISAGGLGLEATTASMNGTHTVGTLAANVTNGVTFTNTGTFEVGTVPAGTSGLAPLSGVNSSGNVTLTATGGSLSVNDAITTAGDVRLNGPGGVGVNAAVSGANVSAYGGDIALGANVTSGDRIYLHGNAVTQTGGRLSGNHLGISADSASLDSATNSIQVLAASIGYGAFSFRNSANFSVGYYPSSASPIITGITALGSVALTAPSFTVDQTLIASGDVTLTGTSSIGVNAGVHGANIYANGGNIDLAGDLNSVDRIYLHGAAVTQTAGNITGNHLGISADSATLQSATNNVHNMAASIGTGAFSFRNSTALNVGQYPSSSSPTISGITALGSVDVSATDLTVNQAIVASGAVSLTGTTSLGVNAGVQGANISAHGGDISLGANLNSGDKILLDGAVMQTAGALSGNTLGVTGSSATLLSSSNNVHTLAANVTGNISYTNSAALSIGQYSAGLSGITAGGNATVSATSVTVDKAVSATGDATLTGAGGIGVNAAVSGANIYANGGDITLGGNLTSGDKVYLNGGAITQTTGTISGNHLGVQATSATFGSTNNVRNLAANVGGSLSFVNTGSLAIGQYSPTLTGITTAGNASITSTSITVDQAINAPGDIVLTGAGGIGVNAGISGANIYANGGDISLGADLTSGDRVYLSGGAVTQSSGRISGNTLGVSAASASLQSAANTVQTVAANTTGNFSYTNSGTLNVGQYSAGLSGITAGGNATVSAGSLSVDKAINAAGNVTLNGTSGIGINAGVSGGGTVALTSTAGAVAQNSSGTITADSLAVSAASGITLDQAINRVTTLAASVTGSGSFSYVNGGSLTVGQVNGVSGIRTSSGNIRVALNSGNLTVNQAINAGNGAVTLLDTAGTVTLNNSITAGRNLGDAGSGSAYSILVAGNSFVNNYGPTALNPGSGRYLIYTNDAWDYNGSQDQWDTMRGNLIGFDKRYGFPYVASNPDGSLHSDGTALNTISNYFFYSFRPALTFTANTNNRYYRSKDPAWTFTVGGLIDHDTLYTAGAAYLADALSRPGVLYTNSNFNSPPGLYDIFFDIGTFYSPINYSLGFVGGKLRIVPPFPQTMTTEKTINSNLVLTYEIPLTKEEVHLFPEDDSLKLWGLTQK